MKLVDVMVHQRSGKMSEKEFRENYRKRSIQNGVKQFSLQTFIKPSDSPTKTNILQSSATFRTLKAQKLGRHAASTTSVRQNAMMQNKTMGATSSGFSQTDSIVPLRTSSELQKKSVSVKTKLPAVRASKNARDSFMTACSTDPYQFLTPQKVPGRHSQLLNNLSQHQRDPTGFMKRVVGKVGLVEQLRAIKNPETMSHGSSMRSLVRSIKGRSLRNEPQLGNSLACGMDTGSDIHATLENYEIEKSYTRLHQLKHMENL